MILTIFTPFTSENQTFLENKVGITNKVLTFEYTKRATKVGDFTLTLPFSDKSASKIKKDYVLWAKDEKPSCWLIVRNIEISLKDRTYTFTGCDAKGYLSQRITLYAEKQDTGTFGYDVVQGTTGKCCNHYVTNNLISPTDSNRKIPGLQLSSGNEAVGIKNDTYMSRFEYISEVIQKLCENAGVWWDVYGDTEKNKFVFVLYEKVNKSASQTALSPIIFSRTRKNVSEVKYQTGNTNFKNAFYSTMSGKASDSSALTTLVLRNPDKVPKGVERKEMQLNVNCDNASEIQKYALHEVTDYTETQAFNAEVCGHDFSLGDIVTIIDKELGLQIDTDITEIKISKSSGSNTVSVVFGKSEPKMLDKLNLKIKNRGG